jgi:hypothetical protein
VFDDLKRMRTPEGNAAVEFHDSEVVRVEVRSQGLAVVLDAYVHRSSGRPGVDSGSGWSQEAILQFEGASVYGGFQSFPASLRDGSLGTPDGVFSNVIPAPSSFRGPIHLELHGVTGERMTVDAASLELVLSGEAKYLDEFPG